MSLVVSALLSVILYISSFSQYDSPPASERAFLFFLGRFQGQTLDGNWVLLLNTYGIMMEQR